MDTRYHAGEIAAQNKAGTRGAAAELSAVMTDSLDFTSNHDVFLEHSCCKTKPT